MPTLRATNVGQNFGTLLLFRQMSFEVSGGESLAITGRNGSGKSTLLQILSGVMTPKAGTVELETNGTVVDAAMRLLHTGLVAPYLSVYDDLTARENLEFLAKARSLEAPSEPIADVLAHVGLRGREDDLVRTFSSGMKQRVKYAAAMLPEPAVLLLDEPSANLDVAGIEMVHDVMDWQIDADRILVVATNVAAEADACHRNLSVEDFLD